MVKVWRPEPRMPELYRLEVNESMLYFLILGLRESATDLRYEIRQHEDKCGDSPTFCQIRYESLINEYGSIEEAVKHTGIILYDCMQDLAHMYTQLGQVAEAIFKMEDLRNRRDGIGEDPDLTDWRPPEKLKEIQDEVAHREAVGRQDTGLMEKIQDDEVDSDAPGGKSILGLTENLPPVNGKKAKPDPSIKANDDKK